jgi:hypothetical protein
LASLLYALCACFSSRPSASSGSRFLREIFPRFFRAVTPSGPGILVLSLDFALSVGSCGGCLQCAEDFNAVTDDEIDETGQLFQERQHAIHEKHSKILLSFLMGSLIKLGRRAGAVNH